MNNLDILKRFSSALTPLISQGLTLEGIRVLVLLGTRPGLTDADIRKQLAMPSGSLSHMMARLTNKGRTAPSGKELPGLNLVDSIPDYDRRQQLYYLTPKGIDLLAQVIARLGGDPLAGIPSPSRADIIKAKMEEYERSLMRPRLVTEE